MKNIIVVLILVLTTISCKAQHIIPVEEGYKYINSEKGFMGDKDYVYVKDINNVLPKFVGTWKGIYNSKNYEFKITKITTDDGELREDKLLIRYKITGSNGKVIENTLSLPNDSPFVMKSGYVDRDGGYVLYYQGKQDDCGQNGDVFIGVYGTNNNKMKLFLSVDGEMWNCTTPAQQILPTDWIDLTKQ